MLVIENHLGSSTTIDAEGPNTSWSRQLEGKVGDEPGRFVLTLDPGRYVFGYSGKRQVSVGQYVEFSGRIWTAVKAGDSLVSPIYRSGRFDEFVYPLSPPAGCPGYVPQPPPPPAQCPAWYVPPQSGFGVLVVENFLNETAEVAGVEATNFTGRIPALKDGEPGVLAIPLAPGSYEFASRASNGEGRIRAEIAAGRFVVASVSRMNPRRLLDVVASAMPVPAGCDGYVPPLPPATTPCPTWYARPEPGRGLLIVVNGMMDSNLIATKGMEYTSPLPAARAAGPGIVRIPVSPGHYEFDTSNTGNHLTADVAADQTLWVYISGFGARQIFGPPPAACK
ncbi:MAG: hypothetical protein HZB53_13015 [Chloroflexi bacterium]|nr:hypothetical protein [Chloroflexota bacterium]